MNAHQTYLKIKKQKGSCHAQRYFEGCVLVMDNDIRAEMRKATTYDTAKQYLQEYCRRHKQKFDKEFDI